VAFRADGEVVATGSQDTSIRLWDAESGKEIAILRGHKGYVDFVAFSPDGKRWLPGDATDGFYYGICLLPRLPIDSWQKQQEARLSVLMDGGSPPGGGRRSLSSMKQAREQKPANFQETILLLAPVAALQTKGLRPYAEVSWRLRIADD
jgi:WD domain, G-beta repeat